MKTGAVIAAAGIGQETFEPMRRYGSITVIERLILTLQKAGVSPIVVVTGNQASLLEKHVSKLGVICLRNSDYINMEMMDSARIGFQYIEKMCDQVLFSPADMALFSYETIAKLMNSGASLAVPVYGEKDGHPVLISSRLLPEIMDYQGKDGLQGAFQCCSKEIDKIQVEDEGILIETDKMDHFKERLSVRNDQLLRPKFSLSLIKEKEFFDQKTADLLRLIKRTESVREACSQMGISYSKCWNILNLVEEQLKYPVLVRHPGGMNGGDTTLSPKGELLLNRFETFFTEADQAVSEIYHRIFEEKRDKFI